MYEQQITVNHQLCDTTPSDLNCSETDAKRLLLYYRLCIQLYTPCRLHNYLTYTMTTSSFSNQSQILHTGIFPSQMVLGRKQILRKLFHPVRCEISQGAIPLQIPSTPKPLPLSPAKLLYVAEVPVKGLPHHLLCLRCHVTLPRVTVC